MTQCTRFLNNAGYNFTLHFPRKLIAGCLLLNKVKVSLTYRNHIEGRPLLFSIQDKITRNRSEFFVQENGKPSMIWLSNSLYYRETATSTWYSRRNVDSEKSEPQMEFEPSAVSEFTWAKYVGCVTERWGSSQDPQFDPCSPQSLQ